MEIARGSWVLPDDPSSPATARRHISSACSGLPRDLLEITLLLTSEVVTNAITHGHGPVRMSLDCDERRLRVEVEDHGPGRPQPARSNVMADSGRGLILLESLATEWGSSPASDSGAGKRVWFAMRTSH
jgi:anti-sigma regulatory factor (Ser/Thr protein kinase)